MEKDTIIFEIENTIITAGDTTCWTCPNANSCPFAFDGYNTNGDCLFIK